MAIDLSVAYPTKVNPPSPAWPFGQPRNITSPGDGTGTPWEQSIIRDLVAWQQGLMIRAGITPSGTPDTAESSQIIESLTKVVGIYFPTLSDAKSCSLLANGSKVAIGGYDSVGDFRLPNYTYDAGSSATVDDGTVHSLTTLPGRYLAIWNGREIELGWYGVKIDGTDAAGNTTKLQAAIVALRHDPQTILDTIGGSNITAYASGTVVFPRGQIAILPDTIEARYDLGLTFNGQGSRRTNQSVRGATVLLISGTSSDWGIRTYRSGGRGFTINHMDVCYATSDFTGDIYDNVDCPGVTFNFVYLGSNGISAGTRLQTARSTHRYTYEEFLTFNCCVFDGAIDGAWSDDVRTELGNTFGGSLVTYNWCVWYDLTGVHIKHSGARTKSGMVLNNCAWNPINESPSRCIDLNNVEGLQINSGVCSTSTGAGAPSVEWVRLVNCTGSVNGVSLADLAKAGTINGILTLSGNSVFCTDGFTLTGGVITAHSNEFSKGTNGWYVDPVSPLCLNLGPDLFKNAVTNSYNIPADSANLSGKISYNADNDASSNKFSNASSRITVCNVDEKLLSVTAGTGGTPYLVQKTDTGRTILAVGSAAQEFDLPVSTPGTKHTITKLSAYQLIVDCGAGNNFYNGDTSNPTRATINAANSGVTIELEAYATVGWLVKSIVGATAITWS